MVSEREKRVAAYAAERFGGHSQVIRYYSDDRRMQVDILSKQNSPQPNLVSYATIGMSGFDNGMALGDLPLRVEVVGIANTDWPMIANGLASCAFAVETGEFRCRPRETLTDVFAELDEGITTPHALFWFPFAWDTSFEGIADDDVTVKWLQVIPISDAELSFVTNGGEAAADELIDRFESLSTDIWDLGRRSVL